MLSISLQLFNHPPYLIIHPPPLLEGPGEGAEKILGYLDLVLVDFLNKIDDFVTQNAKIFRLARCLPKHPFLTSKVRENPPKSLKIQS